MNQIVAHTPTWVFVLFAALLALGLSQTRTRPANLRLVVLRPLPLVALSGWSAISAAAAQPLAIVLWAASLAVLAAALRGGTPAAGTRFDPATRTFTLPGSWVPLLLILGIFSVKYVAGAAVALHPNLATQAAFALPMATLSGVFSGILAGRIVRLVRLAQSSVRDSTPEELAQGAVS
jgi:uncharacterized protein DUF6622